MGQKILLLEDDFFLRDGLCVLLRKKVTRCKVPGTAQRPGR